MKWVPFTPETWNLKYLDSILVGSDGSLKIFPADANKPSGATRWNDMMAAAAAADSRQRIKGCRRPQAFLLHLKHDHSLPHTVCVCVCVDVREIETERERERETCNHLGTVILSLSMSLFEMSFQVASLSIQIPALVKWDWDSISCVSSNNDWTIEIRTLDLSHSDPEQPHSSQTRLSCNDLSLKQHK